MLLRGWLAADAFDRLIARAPRLSWVHSASTGVERALTPGALERGIVITNARGVFSRPIAEYVLMMILAVSRRLPQLLELQRERTWQPLEGAELRDVTVGIVGLGSIGRAVGALATAFGCRVIATRRRSEAGPDPAAPDPERRDARRGAARPGAGARWAAGAAGRIGLRRPRGAADARDRRDDLRRGARGDEARVVADQRRARPARRRARPAPGAPRGADRRRDPRHVPGRAAAALVAVLRPANVIVTPHTSWSSGRVLDRSVELFCDNLRRYAAGEPLLNVVDPSAGY